MRQEKGPQSLNEQSRILEILSLVLVVDAILTVWIPELEDSTQGITSSNEFGEIRSLSFFFFLNGDVDGG